MGIEPATLRLVAQCLNQLRYHVTLSILRLPRNLRKKRGGGRVRGRQKKKIPQNWNTVLSMLGLLMHETLLLLRWHFSPMRTFSSLMDFSQSALLFDLSFQ